MRNLAKKKNKSTTQHGHKWASKFIFSLCLIMLVFLTGISTTTVVSLIDLGKGEHPIGPSQHTGWVYGSTAMVILIIFSVIPAILHVWYKKPSLGTLHSYTHQKKQSARSQESASTLKTQKTKALTHLSGYSAPTSHWINDQGYTLTQKTINQILVQAAAEFLTLMFAALTAVGSATYMMALGNNSASWMSYATAGLIMFLLPVAPYLHVRQLRRCL